MLERRNKEQKAIVLMDRGYSAFNMFEHLNRMENTYYVIRTKNGINAINEIKALPDEECERDFEIPLTTSVKHYNQHKKEGWHMLKVQPKNPHTKNYSKDTRYNKWDFEEDCVVKFRACKFRINDEESGKEEWEVVITNLNRFEFPLEKMKELYHERWGIETAFRDLKYSVGAVQFHCKKDEFIRQEIFAHLTVFNAVSKNCNEVVVSKRGKHDYKLNFKMCVEVVRSYMKKCIYSLDMFAEMLRYVIPIQTDKQDRRREVLPKSAVWFTYRVA